MTGQVEQSWNVVWSLRSILGGATAPAAATRVSGALRGGSGVIGVDVTVRAGSLAGAGEDTGGGDAAASFVAGAGGCPAPAEPTLAVPTAASSCWRWRSSPA